MLSRLALELFRYIRTLFLIFRKTAGGCVPPLMEKHCFRFFSQLPPSWLPRHAFINRVYVLRSVLMRDGPIY